MKEVIFSILLLGVVARLFAQENISNKYDRPFVASEPPYLSNYIITESRLPLYLPEIEGYTLLKCDLHLHTVFSDGTVWPVTRVEEAFREGLDAIAITDHIEFRTINRDDVDTDNLMREYEIAVKKAKELGILLVPGLEITREVPPGHFNVLFLDDPSPLKEFIDEDNPRDASNIENVLEKSKELGGFITWNHPPYQMPDGAEWTEIHQSLYEKGLIMGIEIINSNMYVPIAQKWADEKGLTKMANTDWHGSFRIQEGYHRAMTIVFAKDRSVEAIKNALMNRQTIGYANNYLFGDRKFIEPIFQNSLKTRVLYTTPEKITLEIRNISGLPYEVAFREDDVYKPARINDSGFTIYGNETTAITLEKKMNKEQHEIEVSVENLKVKAGESLKTIIQF